jgi:hypothetical protein
MTKLFRRELKAALSNDMTVDALPVRCQSEANCYLRMTILGLLPMAGSTVNPTCNCYAPHATW